METVAKTIDHYDEKTDQVFRIPLIDVRGWDDDLTWMEAHKGEIAEATLAGISVALKEGYEEVPIFASTPELIVSITADDYINKLETCLQYYISIEAYEFCTWIKELQDKAA